MTASSYDYTETFDDVGYAIVTYTESIPVEMGLFPWIEYPSKKQFKDKETNFKANTIFKSRSEK